VRGGVIRILICSVCSGGKVCNTEEMARAKRENNISGGKVEPDSLDSRPCIPWKRNKAMPWGGFPQCLPGGGLSSKEGKSCFCVESFRKEGTDAVERSLLISGGGERNHFGCWKEEGRGPEWVASLTAEEMPGKGGRRNTPYKGQVPRTWEMGGGNCDKGEDVCNA